LHDHIGAGVNAIRTRTLVERADVVIVRFGEQYRQWNAAFDAGYAAALGKPLITLHPPERDHALAFRRCGCFTGRIRGRRGGSTRKFVPWTPVAVATQRRRTKLLFAGLSLSRGDRI
jgi:nucleoside 2-deoxyribosyltransferase